MKFNQDVVWKKYFLSKLEQNAYQTSLI